VGTGILPRGGGIAGDKIPRIKTSDAEALVYQREVFSLLSLLARELDKITGGKKDAIEHGSGIAPDINGQMRPSRVFGVEGQGGI